MKQILIYRQTGNLGDAVQTVAMSRLLRDAFRGVFRDSVEDSDPQTLFVVNGWLGETTPKLNSNCLFAGVGVHSNRASQAEWIGQSRFPVGSRDPFAYENNVRWLLHKIVRTSLCRRHDALVVGGEVSVQDLLGELVLVGGHQPTGGRGMAGISRARRGSGRACGRSSRQVGRRSGCRGRWRPRTCSSCGCRTSTRPPTGRGGWPSAQSCGGARLLPVTTGPRATLREASKNKRD